MLAVVPQDCDVARIADEAQCGIVVPPGRSSEIAEAIRKLKHSPGDAQTLGQNGRRHLETKFSRRHCVDLYEAMLQRVVS
jgi:colanic acid biosynthesis glycosyl transferase WcaI